MNTEFAGVNGTRPEAPKLISQINRIFEQISELQACRSGIQASLSRLVDVKPEPVDPNIPPVIDPITLEQKLEYAIITLNGLRIEFTSIDRNLQNLI